jgi:hypothetical protein
MKISLYVLSMCLLAVSLFGCGAKQVMVTEEPNALPLETPALSISTGLFVDTNLRRDLPSEPHISRSRFVKVDLKLLLDESGESREVEKIVFNLFPDVVYTGLIEQVERSGDSYSWSGYLQGVENSYFTLVYTSGVFMGHFGSPQGIYEAVVVEDDVYRVIQIDQTKFPGGEG